MTSVIIPVTTIIFSYVKKHEMTNASALQNLVKNVGCALGTSSVGVLVSRYSQIYQSYLVDRLTLLNTTFAERVSEMTSVFMGLGNDFVTAQHISMGNIYKQLMLHSAISAYINSYRVYALATIVVIPLVFVLKKCNQEKVQD